MSPLVSSPALAWAIVAGVVLFLAAVFGFTFRLARQSWQTEAKVVFTSGDIRRFCRERDPQDANYRALEENRERLQQARLVDGSKPEVVDLPMPAPLVFDGRRLPASYANFYIANAAVIVPTFNDPNDRTALGILAELFRDRPVVGVHAVELVWGLGTLHCLTQQQPKA